MIEVTSIVITGTAGNAVYVTEGTYTLSAIVSVTADVVQPPVEPPPVEPPTSDAAIFDDGVNGVTWTYFNKVGNLVWAIPGGTWIDSNGDPQGAVPVTAGTVDIHNYPAWVEIDMQPFMARWEILNDGAFLKSRGGKANYRSREYTDASLRPHLVVLTDQGAFTCSCIGDVRLASTATGGIGDEPSQQFGRGLIRFDLSDVAGAVQSATMRLYTYKVYDGDHQLETFYIDAPTPAA